ncbi:MAG: hypothetical protein J6M46_06875 [Lachnospiraceae bacterium]|nr:hypothetical protein [Lachnospiraceae bacterium]
MKKAGDTAGKTEEYLTRKDSADTLKEAAIHPGLSGAGGDIRCCDLEEDKGGTSWVLVLLIQCS